MYEERKYASDWEEPRLSACFVEYIERKCKEFGRRTGQPWHVVWEHHHGISAVVAGHVKPDAAPRIDIVIFTWGPSYDTLRFPFECKIIAENNTDLIRLYVQKGLIERYLTVKKDYAAHQTWGGMIGYVRQGEPDRIVEKVNGQIDRQLKSATPDKEHLQSRPPVADFSSVYISQHEHPVSTEKLTITHVLLPLAG
jgi:hypothetical protein